MQRSILEVWDYHLSHAQPINYRGQIPVEQEDGSWKLVPHPNWVAVVYSQYDDNNSPLEIHDTGVPVQPGDLHDGPGLDACYEFYRSIRDNHSIEEIEERKPEVAAIREYERKLQALTDEFNDRKRAAKGKAQEEVKGDA